MTTTTGLTFRQYTIPASIDDADAADFIAMVQVRNRIYREISGHDDHAITPSELLPHYRHDEWTTRFAWLVVLDGAVIGRAGLDLPNEDGSRVAYMLIELVRDAWGRGVGSAAHTLIESVAREHGRDVLQTWCEHAQDTSLERITPPTGFGTIPKDHIARFLTRHGYELSQVVRNSVFDLRADRSIVRELLAEAERHSTDYRVLSWQLPTPPELIDGFAWMKSRMSTDAPASTLEIDEEVWDASRVTHNDDMVLAGGRTMLVTVAQHIETGELAAFNELVIGADRTEASHQEDTLVLAEHRGHRLGMLVKCAGILAWGEIAPDSPRIMTYNAEENRPMLSINEAIGFVPLAYEGAWKKTLT